MIMRVTRRVAPLLLAVAALLPLLLALGAGSAQAQGPFGSCEEAPSPEYPGAGTVGSLDPPQVDKGHPGSAYNEHSYAGQVWHTYGVCPTDINGTSDTYLGNKMFDLGKAIVSATNGLHWLQRDGGFLSQMDDLVSQGTVALYDSVFLTWVGLALVIAAVAALWWSLKGNFAAASKKAMYAVIALTVAAASYLTPLTYTTLADGLLTNGVTTLQNQVLSQTMDEEMQAETALPETLHHYAVYEPWLKGEFGSVDSPEAQRYGSQLLDAQACSKADMMQARQGGEGCSTEQKQQAYEAIASDLEGTPVYETFTGESGNRIGAGAMSLLTSMFFSVFQVMCLLAIFLGMLILRLVVLMGPVLGAVAIVYPTLLHRALAAVGAAVGYGVALSGVSLGHLVILRWIAENQPGGELGVLVLSGLITTLLWYAVKPGKKFRAMMSSSMRLVGAEPVSWEHLKQMRLMRSMRRRQGPREINFGGRFEHGERAPRSEAGGVDDEMPEAASGTYRAESQRLDRDGPRVEGQQAPAVAAAPDRSSGAAGAAATGAAGMPPSAPAGPRTPSDGPHTPPPAAPPRRPSHGPDESGAPQPPALGPAPNGAEPSALRRDESTGQHEGGSEPPRVVRPSEYWSSSGSDGDTTSADNNRRSESPRRATSYDDRGRRGYRVYRPSSGRVEVGDDSTPPASRPEQEQ